MVRISSLLTVLAVCVVGSTASASSGAASLHKARIALAGYAAESTLTAIGDLGALITNADNEADRREASFLRSVAAADLLLIAQQRNDAEMRDAVARALGATPETAASRLQRELTAIARGVYAATANDAAKAMALLAKATPATLSDLQGWSGLRRDLFMLGLLRQNTQSGADPLTALATLGNDPCADPEAACAAPYALFDATGRKAIAALTESSQIVTRLRRAAREGEPLSRALEDDIAQTIDALTGLTLRPVPLINAEWKLTEAGGRAVQASPDLLIVVGATEARFGFVPRVRFNAGGEIEIVASGQPMLTNPARVTFPGTFAPSIRPISELAASLVAALGKNHDVSVALGATPDAPAHLVARVLHSVRGAGAHAAWLLARSSEGFAQAIPMEVMTNNDTTTKPASLYLRIRLGGYTVKMGNQEGDIPRVKNDDGWRFDLASLDAAIAGRQLASTEVTFMGDLAAQHLVEAAFHVAPTQSALRLVIP